MKETIIILGKHNFSSLLMKKKNLDTFFLQFLLYWLTDRYSSSHFVEILKRTNGLGWNFDRTFPQKKIINPNHFQIDL